MCHCFFTGQALTFQQEIFELFSKRALKNECRKVQCLLFVYRKYFNKSRPQIRAAPRLRAAFYLVKTALKNSKT